jgi:hypothetical protein
MDGMLWIFSPEKSDGFGRVRTRDLGYQIRVVLNAVQTHSIAAKSCSSQKVQVSSRPLSTEEAWVHGPVHVTLLTEVAMGHVYLPVRRLSPVTITAQMHCTQAHAAV